MCGLRWWRVLAGVSLIIVAALLVPGCGDLTAPGTDESGSLLNVDLVQPKYFDKLTKEVDIVWSDCDGDQIPDEPYTDHYADVTLTNRPLPNHEDQTASTIHLVGYEVWYTPGTQDSPHLPSLNVIPIAESVAVPPCEPGSTSCTGVTFTAQFVPISQKQVLAGHLDDPEKQFRYNVRYRFYGENDFGKDVSADGFSNFVAGGYDHCVTEE